jgi:DNA invertase Pin-like site-specific DNA recombinase
MPSIDKASGKDFDRPQYIQLKRALRSGDTLYIKSIDSLGRNKSAILEEWRWLTEKGVHVVVIDMPILDTRKYADTAGVGQLITDIVLQVLSWLAEEERTTIRKRQAEGIASAKSIGKHLGRPKMDVGNLTESQRELLRTLYPDWKTEKMTAVNFMQRLGLRKSTFYKIIAEYEAAK